MKSPRSLKITDREHVIPVFKNDSDTLPYSKSAFIETTKKPFMAAVHGVGYSYFINRLC